MILISMIKRFWFFFIMTEFRLCFGCRAIKYIENILKTYVDPFKVKDGREKTEKELARSKASKAKLNQEVQDILQSDQIQNIINSSISKEEAQGKINAFIK